MSPAANAVTAAPSPEKLPRVGAPAAPGSWHTAWVQLAHASDIWSEPPDDTMPFASPPQALKALLSAKVRGIDEYARLPPASESSTTSTQGFVGSQVSVAVVSSPVVHVTTPTPTLYVRVAPTSDWVASTMWEANPRTTAVSAEDETGAVGQFPPTGVKSARVVYVTPARHCRTVTLKIDTSVRDLMLTMTR